MKYSDRWWGALKNTGIWLSKKISRYFNHCPISVLAQLKSLSKNLTCCYSYIFLRRKLPTNLQSTPYHLTIDNADVDTIRSLPQVWTKKSWRRGSFYHASSSPWYTDAERILFCLLIHFRKSGLLKRYGWVSWNIIGCAFSFTCSEISMSTECYKQ